MERLGRKHKEYCLLLRMLAHISTPGQVCSHLIKSSKFRLLADHKIYQMIRIF
jgi:hypothetical protein